MNEVIAKATSPALASPRAHNRINRPVSPACSTVRMMLCSSQMLVNRVQVLLAARRHSSVTPPMRASSRASAPKLFTVGFEAIESDRAPPMRLSSATDRRLAGRA